jgi:hypothetical protein
MTGKADFAPEEWELIAGGPPAAGLAVAAAESGGSFRESFALAKAYGEARSAHGESQLLDELVSERPHLKGERAQSAEELKQVTLKHLRDALLVLREKATAEEVEGYRSFVIEVANRVANAHKEDGVAVGPAEQAMIEEITASLD